MVQTNTILIYGGEQVQLLEQLEIMEDTTLGMTVIDSMVINSLQVEQFT